MKIIYSFIIIVITIISIFFIKKHINYKPENISIPKTPTEATNHFENAKQKKLKSIKNNDIFNSTRFEIIADSAKPLEQQNQNSNLKLIGISIFSDKKSAVIKNKDTVSIYNLNDSIDNLKITDITKNFVLFNDETKLFLEKNVSSYEKKDSKNIINKSKNNKLLSEIKEQNKTISKPIEDQIILSEEQIIEKIKSTVYRKDAHTNKTFLKRDGSIFTRPKPGDRRREDFLNNKN